MTYNHQKKSKKNDWKAVLVTAVLLFAVAAGWTYFSPTDPIRETLLSVSAPVGVEMRASAGTVKRSFSREDRENDAARDAKIKELQQTIEELREKVSALDEVRRENEDLKAYLHLSDTVKEMPKVAAHIYAMSGDGKFFFIDKGSADGVAVGQMIMGADGLWGFVTEVNVYTAQICSLLHSQNAIGALVSRSGVCGVIDSYNSAAGTATINYIEWDKQNAAPDICVGDMIVTSGEGGRYAAGIPIGEVIETGINSYDRTPYAFIRLYCREGTASLVMVLLTGGTENE